MHKLRKAFFHREPWILPALGGMVACQKIYLPRSEYDLIWRKDLFKSNWESTYEIILGYLVGPKHNEKCPYPRKAREIWDSLMPRGHMALRRQRQRLDLCTDSQADARSHQKLEGEERSSPRAFGESEEPLTPPLQTTCRNPECERIKSCCFKPLNVWLLVIAGLGNHTLPKG